MKNCNERNHTLRLGAVLLLLCLSATLGACVKQVQHPALDVTFLPQKGEFISKYGDRLTLEEIIGISKDKDYILIGEGHKNAEDHKVQQALLKALAGSGRGLSVGLEMVSVDMQPVLDDFAAGRVEVDALEEELQWKTRWGYPFSLFRPLFETVNRNSLPVAGLNLPSSVIKKISKQGLDSLTEDERALLPGKIVPPVREQLDFLDAIYAQHEGREADNATAKERFRLIQSVWDSKMAEEAVRLRRQYDWPVLIIAGAGHVENGWGIARRIRRFDPGASILLLMPWRGGEFDRESADAFFYSPDSYNSRMGALLTATGRGGLLVERVTRGSRAEKAGLRPGDVLVEAAAIPLDHLFDLHMAGAKVHKADVPLVFTVRRGSETFAVDVGKLGKRSKGSSKAAAKDAAGKAKE